MVREITIEWCGYPTLKIFLFRDLLLSPISQHSVWSEITRVVVLVLVLKESLRTNLVLVLVLVLGAKVLVLVLDI